MKLTGNEKIITINVNNLENNLNVIKKEYPKLNIIGVIKADAYGHGSRTISNYLFDAGVNTFAVASIDEAIIVLDNNKELEILILGHTNPDILSTLNKSKVIQAINSISYYEKVKTIDIKKHLNINTGMNRFGIYYNAYQLEELVSDANVVGIFTHFYNNKNKKTTMTQLKRFSKLNFEIMKHTSLTEFNIIKNNVDAIRVGLALYGYEKFDWSKDLKPVMSLCAQIINISVVRKGETISYNALYKTDRDLIVGTVSIGYADGIPFNYTDGYVFYKDKKCKILGQITMDYIIIDLSGVDYDLHDYVEIFGENISASEVAEKSKTIVYEILVRVSNRAKRKIIRKSSN